MSWTRNEGSSFKNYAALLPLFTLICISTAEKAIYFKARHYLNQALKRDPQRSEIHNNLGTLFLETGKYEEARQEFELAITLEKKKDAAAAPNTDQ